MPDTATLLAVTRLTAATDGQGPGDTLRIVLAVSMVGAVFLAWFLLRGYRDNGSGEGPEEPGKGPGNHNERVAEKRND
ncbi:hypothetical protein [Streptomyces odonnellii]|uniref:hypothetical protein n=1 Tax=Streptomyces odonnellii TaxID=1417980 RepID=UPI000625FD10|nr:hypothetical protein [Streptomyces odonnellii]